MSGKSARPIAGERAGNERGLHIWKQHFQQPPAGQVVPPRDAPPAENRRLWDGQGGIRATDIGENRVAAAPERIRLQNKFCHRHCI